MDDFETAFENHTLQRLGLFIYLIPVFGVLPALWTLNRRQSSKSHREVSRLVVILALVWVSGYSCLNLGAGWSGEVDAQGLRTSLLLLNTLLTSSYFLTQIGLMVRLWQGQSLQLPGLSRLARHLP